MDEKKYESDFFRAARITPYAVAFAFLVISLIYFSNFNGSFGNQSDFGAFGDFLGGVLNPILSFFAIVLLIASIKFQLEELKGTRKEMANSAIAQKESTVLQSQNMKLQLSLFVNQSVKDELILISNEFEKLLSTIVNDTNKTFADFVEEKSDMELAYEYPSEKLSHATRIMGDIARLAYRYDDQRVLLGRYPLTHKMFSATTESLELKFNRIAHYGYGFKESEGMCRKGENIIELLKREDTHEFYGSWIRNHWDILMDEEEQE